MNRLCKRGAYSCFRFFVLIVLALPAQAEEHGLEFAAIVPLTGSSAVYGQWTVRGLQVAADQENDWRRKAGQNPIRLVVEDNQFQAAASVTLFHSVTRAGVAGIFSTSSPMAMVLAPLANRAGVPLMDVSAATPKYSTPDDYTFRTAVLADTLVQQIKSYLAALPPAESAGALIIESEYGQGMLDSFHKSSGVELARVELFKPGEVDIRPQALRLRAAGINVLWFVSQIKESSSLVRQLAQQLPGVQLVSDCYSVEGTEFLASAGQSAEGIVYAAPACLLSGASSTTDYFVQAFREKHASEPNYFEAQAFDGGRALFHALRQCSSGTRECLRDALSKLDIEGACGRLKFDTNGDVHYEAVLKQIKQGKFVLLAQ